MLTFSLTMTWRDWRAGELRFMLAALALAVASLTGVQFFGERMSTTLARDASQLLGGDLRIASEAPLDRAWRREADILGLLSAETIELQTMVTAGEGAAAASHMVSLKAVGAGYPLRGALTLHALAGTASAGGVPPLGTAWVDPALLAALGLQLGQVIEVGERRLTMTRTIAAEPDRGPAALMFSPRVMIALADVQASGLLQAGAMASWDLLLAGDASAVSAFETWGKTQQAAPGRLVTIQTLAASSAATGEALGRANTFLLLVGVLATLLASVAVAMTARRFMLRHADACAMLLCLGMPHARVVAMFMIEFLLVGVAASALGVAIGFAVHLALLEWVGALVSTGMAPASAAPAVRGMVVGVLLLAGCALPSLLQLRAISPARLLRRGPEAPRRAMLLAGVLGMAIFTTFMLWQSSGLAAGLIAAAALALLLLLYVSAARMAVAALVRVPGPLQRGAWRVAVAGMRRQPAAAVTRIVALALGLTALLLMTIVRSDLLQAWKDSAPADAPNHIIYNIQPHQKAALDARLRPLGHPGLVAMMRGRLVAINGKPLQANELQDPRAKRLVEREIEVGTAAQLPPANVLLAGRWFGSASGPEMSVSQISAQALGLKLGDTVSLDFAGSRLTAQVTSLRKVDWRSRRSNFGFMINPAAARDVAATYATTLFIPAAGKSLVHALMREFPNLTILDTGAVFAQLQRVLDQVAGAVEFLFLFTLGGGLMVLYATLAATQDERERQAALLRALGASRAQLLQAQVSELALTGALAGVLAAAGASAGSWALARFAFQLEWHFSPLLWAIAIAAGALCAVAGGAAGLHAVLATSPLRILRAQ